MSEWKDTTSYSRGDKEKLPTTYSIRLGDLRLTVTCGHIYDRGQWCVQFAPFYNNYFLGFRKETTTAEQAQALALDMAKKKIEAVSAALTKTTQE